MNELSSVAMNEAQLAVATIRRAVQLARLADDFVQITSTELDAQLQQIRGDQAELSAIIGSSLDQRIAQQQVRVAEKQQQMAVQTSVLVLLTLLLVAWVSGRVTAPVKRLDQLIRAMGQQQVRPARDTVGGPRELNALGHRLYWLSGRLEQLEALRLVLLRHASHELKTPLASIQEGCSLLAEQLAGPLNDRQNEVVGLLAGSAGRLNQLTEQLLDYNRLLQQARPELSWIAAEPLVQQVIAEHALAIQQRQQTVILNCQIDSLNTDSRLLTRILDNLINNAQATGQRWLNPVIK